MQHVCSLSLYLKVNLLQGHINGETLTYCTSHHEDLLLLDLKNTNTKKVQYKLQGMLNMLVSYLTV